MERCGLHYIPNRLHSENRDTIDEFFHGEDLYVRHEIGQPPFMTKPLYELSINRQGSTTAIMSHPDDVLFNIDPSELKPEEKYEGMGVDAMRVRQIDPESKTYVLVYNQEEGEEDNRGTLEMKLVHNPLPCNYSHSLFRIFFKEVVVEKKNYKQTIGRRNIAMGKLRDFVRKELEGMIYRREVPLGRYTI